MIIITLIIIILALTHLTKNQINIIRFERVVSYVSITNRTSFQRVFTNGTIGFAASG